MKRINLHIDESAGMAVAEGRAREALANVGNVSLTAWYDSRQGTGGPLEPCAEEPRKCVRDYARSHGASFEVSINDERMELYFAPTPKDAVELDRKEVVEVHRGLENDRFENQQGG